MDPNAGPQRARVLGDTEMLNSFAEDFGNCYWRLPIDEVAKFEVLSPEDCSRIWRPDAIAQALKKWRSATFGNYVLYDEKAEEYYIRFVLCPGDGEPFDGFFAIYLEIDATSDRLIWSDLDNEVHECVLMPGVFEGVNTALPGLVPI
jgi:hypothetical protein